MARQYEVAVFDTNGKRVRSYTRYFKGCCLHRVMADNIKQARAIAVGAHKDMCIRRRPADAR